MITTRQDVEKVINTLPVGYYLKRDINVILSDGSATLYNPIEDKILISAPTIINALSSFDATLQDREELIRGLLYHEISHVILTPDIDNVHSYLNYYHCPFDIFNIFEDERIETILNNFYMNTNFKRNLIRIQGTEADETVSVMNKFFNIVRYRKGDKKLVKRVQQIIRTYFNINHCTTDIDSYIRDIKNLWEDVQEQAKKEAQERANQQSQTNSTQQDSKGSNASNEQNSSNDDNTSEDTNSEDTTSEDNSNDNSDDTTSNTDNNSSTDETTSEDNADDTDGNSEDTSSSSMDDTDSSMDDTEDGVGDDTTSKANNTEDETEDSSSEDESNCSDDATSEKTDNSDDTSNSSSTDRAEDSEENLNDFEDLLEEIEKQLDMNMDDDYLNHFIEDAMRRVFNEYQNEEIKKNLQRILRKVNTRKGLTNPTKITYQGRINPKLVGTRKDYKWSTKKAGSSYLKGNKKLHINLWIDNSGSFKKNEHTINEFLTAIESVTSREFDYDVIAIGDGVNEVPKGQFFKCSGVNRTLFSVVNPMFKKHQMPTCDNYNIVLFDGDCHSFDYITYYSQNKVADKDDGLRCFNKNNCIIVSDKSNKKAIELCAPNARTVITYNYAKEFINEVLALMERTL